MRLIDADELKAYMYHEAFETDTDMQKWDSGCWIRYKMFENQIEKVPTVEAIPIEWLKKQIGRLSGNGVYGAEVYQWVLNRWYEDKEEWKKENESNF